MFRYFVVCSNILKRGATVSSASCAEQDYEVDGYRLICRTPEAYIGAVKYVERNHIVVKTEKNAEGHYVLTFPYAVYAEDAKFFAKPATSP